MQSIASDFLGVNEKVVNQDYWATIRKLGRGGMEISVRAIGMVKEARIPGLPRTMSDAEREERDRLNRLRSCQRARQQLRWIVKASGADHLLTLVYRDNVTDLERVQKDWQSFQRTMRIRYPDLKFVCIREYQQRGSIHLHVAVAGRLDVHWVRRAWWKALGHEVEIWYDENGKKHLRALVKDDKGWRHCESSEVRGNVDLRFPSKRFGDAGKTWRPDKLAGYLTKYLEKTFDEADQSKRRFWPSKNCERAVVIKRWLGATNTVDAIREAHDIVHREYGMQNTTLWLSIDQTSIWISGYGIEPPF